jgi:hypothetical protein
MVWMTFYLTYVMVVVMGIVNFCIQFFCCCPIGQPGIGSLQNLVLTLQGFVCHAKDMDDFLLDFCNGCCNGHSKFLYSIFFYCPIGQPGIGSLQNLVLTLQGFVCHAKDMDDFLLDFCNGC